jgi:DNA-binding transcriptional LysR family regulator
MNIRNKDLNLLPVFVAIAEESNLSRASGRLRLSQPALSHALSRLRKQFGDPLFVRGQRGLVATPKVATLLPQVRAALAGMDSLYEPKSLLDLSTLTRTVVIAATEYFEARTVAQFVGRARAEAPGVRIETRSLRGGFPKRELESGEFDLAVAAYFDDLPNYFRVRTVFRDRFVCVCAKANPYLQTKQTAADYLEARHLQIEVPPGVFAPVDQHLQEKRKQRVIALRVGNFLTPPLVLCEAELLLTCPSSLAEAYCAAYPLVATELPFRLAGLETKMVWHQKDQHDPFHVWLRTCLSEGGLA